MMRSRGFTLIELMIVVMIVAILAAVGYPAYQSQVEKAHLSEGRTALTRFATEMERCYSRFGSYNDDDCGVFQAVEDDDYSSENGTYKITLDGNESGANSFKADAERQEAKDMNECGDLTLTHTGQKGVDGADSGVTADDCW